MFQILVQVCVFLAYFTIIDLKSLKDLNLKINSTRYFFSIYVFFFVFNKITESIFLFFFVNQTSNKVIISAARIFQFHSFKESIKDYWLIIVSLFLIIFF